MLKKTIGNGVKGAFTLAEVLITLGILGVVAAMTMPTLINSTQGAQYKTAYKKALSVMSQAVVMNIALDDYDLSQVVAGTKQGQDADGEAQTLYTLFKNRMNVVKVANTTDFNDTDGDPDCWKLVGIADGNETLADADALATLHGNTDVNFSSYIDSTTWSDDKTVLFFNDGISFIFDNTQANCMAATATEADHYCTAFIDVNGQKAPNRLVACDTGSLDTTDSGKDDGACTVTNPTDIYPVFLYDQSIIPAAAAARAVLYAK